MLRNMKDGWFGFLLFLVCMAVLLIAGLFFGQPKAGATPAQDLAEKICDAMDSASEEQAGIGVTDQQITNINRDLWFSGLTTDQMAEGFAAAALEVCPEWQQAFVDYHTELTEGVFSITDDWKVVYSPAPPMPPFVGRKLI